MENQFETIEIENLSDVTGGRGFWDRALNLGKAAVNGVYNVLPDKITGVDAKGASVKGSWDKDKNFGGKPFKDDPLAKFRNER